MVTFGSEASRCGSIRTRAPLLLDSGTEPRLLRPPSVPATAAPACKSRIAISQMLPCILILRRVGGTKEEEMTVWMLCCQHPSLADELEAPISASSNLNRRRGIICPKCSRIQHWCWCFLQKR